MPSGSLAETPHRLMLDGRQLYAFCAVDAVGIPAALQVDAQVESRCHMCGALVTLALNFFCSVEHLDEWQQTAPRPGGMVSLDEAADAGRRLWGAMR